MTTRVLFEAVTDALAKTIVAGPQGVATFMRRYRFLIGDLYVASTPLREDMPNRDENIERMQTWNGAYVPPPIPSRGPRMAGQMIELTMTLYEVWDSTPEQRETFVGLYATELRRLRESMVSIMDEFEALDRQTRPMLAGTRRHNKSHLQP